MKRTVAMMMIVMMFLSGCKPERVVTDGRLKSVWSQVSSRDYIRTRGIGVPDPEIQGLTHRRAAARNAALVAARYEMLAIIKGIRITGGLRIADLIEKNSRIKEIADRIIEGAEEVQTEWADDDGCVVVLELKRSKVRKILKRDEKREARRLPLWSPGPQSMRTRVGVARLRKGGYNPRRAVVLGLLLPGWGQMVAADYIRNEDEAARLKTRGFVTMGGVLGTAALGIGLITGEQSQKTDPRTGKPEKTDGKSIGYGLLGVAALLHVWGARDAGKTLEKDNYSVTLTSDGTGMSIGVAKRF